MNLITVFGNKAIGYPIINLDHVAEFRPRRMNEHGDPDAYAAIGVDGRELGMVCAYRIRSFMEGSVTRQIIPNTQPIVIVYPWWNLEAGRLETHESPIVAWTVDGYSAIPVTENGPSDDNNQWLRWDRSTGAPLFCQSHDTGWVSQEAFREAATKAAQALLAVESQQ